MNRSVAQILLIFGCAVLCATAGAAKSWPSRVTYNSAGSVLGVESGLSADLDTGVVSEDVRPGGSAPAVTGRGTLTAERLRALRRLANAIWRDGPQRPLILAPLPDRGHRSLAAWRRAIEAAGRKQQAQIAASQCVTLDAFGHLELVKHGATRTFDFSTPCLSDDANALVNALRCGVHPDDAAYCTAPKL